MDRKVKKITGEERLALERLSAASLPDSPSQMGMKPAAIKAAFWQALTKGERSVTGLMDRVIEEINDGFEEGDVLQSTGDYTDRLEEIQTLLDEMGYVKLGKGEFYLSGQLQIKNGATLDGCGKATVIKQTTDSTQPSMIWLRSEGTIRNVCLQGEWTSAPTADTTYEADRIGIVVAYGTNNAIIDGCWIWGWTAQGVYAFENGTATRSFLMSNCDVAYCGAGLKLLETEYACVTNCVFRNNKYGVENRGGNNKFTACGFDMNDEGFRLMDGYNDGHGSVVGCSFNHSETRAVRVSGVENGYLFSGCQFHYGCINNNNGKGIVFNACQFGNGMKYYNYTESPTLFVGCIFSKSPKTESAEYLDGYNGFRFVDCINYLTGESVDTVDGGKDGKDGKDGEDGEDGKDGKDGYTPVKGVDYFTEADVAEIVAMLLDELKKPVKGAAVKSATFMGDCVQNNGWVTTPSLEIGKQYYIEDTLFTAELCQTGEHVSPPIGTTFTGVDGVEYVIIGHGGEGPIINRADGSPLPDPLVVTIYEAIVNSGGGSGGGDNNEPVMVDLLTTVCGTAPDGGAGNMQNLFEVGKGYYIEDKYFVAEPLSTGAEYGVSPPNGFEIVAQDGNVGVVSKEPGSWFISWADPPSESTTFRVYAVVGGNTGGNTVNKGELIAKLSENELSAGTNSPFLEIGKGYFADDVYFVAKEALYGYAAPPKETVFDNGHNRGLVSHDPNGWFVIWDNPPDDTPVRFYEAV